MTDHNRILDKIKKCRAMSKSSNEHEAAIALRQMQKLMQEHNLSEGDVLAHLASEARAKAGARATPPGWESNLAQIVAEAFRCKIVFSRRWDGSAWAFIGCGAAPEIAQYAMTVLLRQLKRQRADFIVAKCKRLKPASKTRRADLYCEAWVAEVYRQVQSFSGADQDEVSESAIAAYMDKHYAKLDSLKVRDRNDGRAPRGNDWDAIDAGQKAGKNARLNHGVSAAKRTALGCRNG